MRPASSYCYVGVLTSLAPSISKQTPLFRAIRIASLSQTAEPEKSDYAVAFFRAVQNDRSEVHAVNVEKRV